MLATADTGKTQEMVLKSASEWTGRVEISKEEIHGSRGKTEEEKNQEELRRRIELWRRGKSRRKRRTRGRVGRKINTHSFLTQRKGS